jgi:hypothetical protein
MPKRILDPENKKLPSLSVSVEKKIAVDFQFYAKENGTKASVVLRDFMINYIKDSKEKINNENKKK